MKRWMEEMKWKKKARMKVYSKIKESKQIFEL